MLIRQENAFDSKISCSFDSFAYHGVFIRIQHIRGHGFKSRYNAFLTFTMTNIYHCLDLASQISIMILNGERTGGSRKRIILKLALYVHLSFWLCVM